MGRASEYADGVGGRRRAAVIRAATGDDVIIGEQELRHAPLHVATRPGLEPHHSGARQPDDRPRRRCAQTARVPVVLDGRYLLAVVKLTPAGAFFASMYPTGRSIRPSHRRFRKVLP